MKKHKPIQEVTTKEHTENQNKNQIKSAEKTKKKTKSRRRKPSRQPSATGSKKTKRKKNGSKILETAKSDNQTKSKRKKRLKEAKNNEISILDPAEEEFLNEYHNDYRIPPQTVSKTPLTSQKVKGLPKTSSKPKNAKNRKLAEIGNLDGLKKSGRKERGFGSNASWNIKSDYMYRKKSASGSRRKIFENMNFQKRSLGTITGWETSDHQSYDYYSIRTKGRLRDSEILEPVKIKQNGLSALKSKTMTVVEYPGKNSDRDRSGGVSYAQERRRVVEKIPTKVNVHKKAKMGVSTVCLPSSSLQTKEVDQKDQKQDFKAYIKELCTMSPKKAENEAKPKKNHHFPYNSVFNKFGEFEKVQITQERSTHPSKQPKKSKNPLIEQKRAKMTMQVVGHNKHHRRLDSLQYSSQTTSPKHSQYINPPEAHPYRKNANPIHHSKNRSIGQKSTRELQNLRNFNHLTHLNHSSSRINPEELTFVESSQRSLMEQSLDLRHEEADEEPEMTLSQYFERSRQRLEILNIKQSDYRGFNDLNQRNGWKDKTFYNKEGTGLGAGSFHGRGPGRSQRAEKLPKFKVLRYRQFNEYSSTELMDQSLGSSKASQSFHRGLEQGAELSKNAKKSKISKNEKLKKMKTFSSSVENSFAVSSRDSNAQHMKESRVIKHQYELARLNKLKRLPGARKEAKMYTQGNQRVQNRYNHPPNPIKLNKTAFKNFKKIQPKRRKKLAKMKQSITNHRQKVYKAQFRMKNTHLHQQNSYINLLGKDLEIFEIQVEEQKQLACFEQMLRLMPRNLLLSSPSSLILQQWPQYYKPSQFTSRIMKKFTRWTGQVMNTKLKLLRMLESYKKQAKRRTNGMNERKRRREERRRKAAERPRKRSKRNFIREIIKENLKDVILKRGVEEGAGDGDFGGFVGFRSAGEAGNGGGEMVLIEGLEEGEKGFGGVGAGMRVQEVGGKGGRGGNGGVDGLGRLRDTKSLEGEPRSAMKVDHLRSLPQLDEDFATHTNMSSTPQILKSDGVMVENSKNSKKGAFQKYQIDTSPHMHQPLNRIKHNLRFRGFKAIDRHQLGEKIKSKKKEWLTQMEQKRQQRRTLATSKLGNVTNNSSKEYIPFQKPNPLTTQNQPEQAIFRTEPESVAFSRLIEAQLTPLINQKLRKTNNIERLDMTETSWIGLETAKHKKILEGLKMSASLTEGVEGPGEVDGLYLTKAAFRKSRREKTTGEGRGVVEGLTRHQKHSRSLVRGPLGHSGHLGQMGGSIDIRHTGTDSKHSGLGKGHLEGTESPQKPKLGTSNKTYSQSVVVGGRPAVRGKGFDQLEMKVYRLEGVTPQKAKSKKMGSNSQKRSKIALNLDSAQKVKNARSRLPQVSIGKRKHQSGVKRGESKESAASGTKIPDLKARGGQVVSESLDLQRMNKYIQNELARASLTIKKGFIGDLRVMGSRKLKVTKIHQMSKESLRSLRMSSNRSRPSKRSKKSPNKPVIKRIATQNSDSKKSKISKFEAKKITSKTEESVIKPNHELGGQAAYNTEESDASEPEIEKSTINWEKVVKNNIKRSEETKRASRMMLVPSANHFESDLEGGGPLGDFEGNDGMPHPLQSLVNNQVYGADPSDADDLGTNIIQVIDALSKKMR